MKTKDALRDKDALIFLLLIIVLKLIYNLQKLMNVLVYQGTDFYF